MADKKELSLEERQVIALEKQAKATEKLTYAVEDIADFFHSAEIGKFTEKLEWYLYEFHQILKTKQVGGSSSRPDKGYERDFNEDK
jgi:hypothetical protein